MLSVGKVWEQRSSFGAQGVFSGETSLKHESILDSSGKQGLCDSVGLNISVHTCDTPGCRSKQAGSLTSFLSLLPENLEKNKPKKRHEHQNLNNLVLIFFFFFYLVKPFPEYTE